MDTKEGRRVKADDSNGLGNRFALRVSELTVFSLYVDLQVTSRTCRLQYLRLIGIVQLVKHARRSLR